MFWKVCQPTKLFHYLCNIKQKFDNDMEILLTILTICLGASFFGWVWNRWSKLFAIPPTPEQLEDIDWHNTLN